MNGVIINADDFGMDAGVDHAILSLIDRGIVTSTSVMVLAAEVEDAARPLATSGASVGLHLDLTSAFHREARWPTNLGRLLVASHLHLVTRELIRVEVNRQLELFEEAFGQAPAFVDGHQHVHHLPVIRDGLLEALQARYGDDARRVGLRICLASRWRGAKAFIIARTGAGALLDHARLEGHATNTDFAGVYDFAPDADLNALWRTWLETVGGAAPLIMCHPAAPGFPEAEGDPIRRARFKELAYLSSSGFSELLKALGLTPIPWPR